MLHATLRCVAVGLTLLVTMEAHQSPTSLTLSPRDAFLAEEFSQLESVRELQDGRVLLIDRKETRLVVADAALRGVTVIDSVGSGPGEFKGLSLLVALGGDSTLLVDNGNGRWLLLNGATVVATISANAPAYRAVFAGRPDGADHNGHLLSRDCWGGDSVCVTLVERANGRWQQVAMMRIAGIGPKGTVRALPRQDGKSGGFSITNSPARTTEQPLLFADGWVAVARHDPYRVDWRSPDGRWTRGAPIPHREVRFTREEREAFIARRRCCGNATEWPDFAPPFELFALTAAPDGSLLVRRFQSAAEEDVPYDVIERTGRLRGTLRLPKDQHILGFGARSVYVVVTDDDGIQRVARHPWR